MKYLRNYPWVMQLILFFLMEITFFLVAQAKKEGGGWMCEIGEQ